MHFWSAFVVVLPLLLLFDSDSLFVLAEDLWATPVCATEATDVNPHGNAYGGATTC